MSGLFMVHALIKSSNHFEALLIEKENSGLFYINKLTCFQRVAQECGLSFLLVIPRHFFFPNWVGHIRVWCSSDNWRKVFFFFLSQFYPCRVGWRGLEPIPATGERQGTSLDKFPALCWALTELLQDSLPFPRAPRQCAERCLLQQVELPTSLLK